MSEPRSSNPLDEIRKNLSREVVEWDPSAGDSVVGYIDRLEVIESERGLFPALHVRGDEADGPVMIVYCGRAVLRRQLTKLKAQPGDAVGVLYEGKKPSKSGGEYHSYRVELIRVGERRPDEAFRDPEDSDLVAGAADEVVDDNGVDDWSPESEAGF